MTPNHFPILRPEFLHYLLWILHTCCHTLSVWSTVTRTYNCASGKQLAYAPTSAFKTRHKPGHSRSRHRTGEGQSSAWAGRAVDEIIDRVLGQLSAQQRRGLDVRLAFNMYDQRQTGQLSFSDFNTALRQLGVGLSPLSVCLSVCPSICPSVCLSVHSTASISSLSALLLPVKPWIA